MSELVPRRIEVAAEIAPHLQQQWRLHRIRTEAARTEAALHAASAVYDAAAQYPGNPTVRKLRDRYFRR